MPDRLGSVPSFAVELEAIEVDVEDGLALGPRRSGEYDVLRMQLDATKATDQIPPIALGFLGPAFKRSLFLIVKNGALASWDGNGKEIPLDRPSVFADVVAGGRRHAGPLDGWVAERLGTRAPLVMIAPVKVKDRVPCVLYGEAASEEELEDARALTDRVARLAGEALVRLILAAKRR